MLTKEPKIAVVGAGAIGGTTAAFIKRAGWDLEIVCKHQKLADIINHQGVHITGIKGEHQIKLKAIEKTSDFSEPKDLVSEIEEGKRKITLDNINELLLVKR